MWSVWAERAAERLAEELAEELAEAAAEATAESQEGGMLITNYVRHPAEVGSTADPIRKEIFCRKALGLFESLSRVRPRVTSANR